MSTDPHQDESETENRDLDENLVQVGAFDPFEAKQVIALLEANAIPFEVETDHAALLEPARGVQLYFGMYPEGSRIIIFVPEHQEPAATEVLSDFFRA
jgi:hypothetical protein